MRTRELRTRILVAIGAGGLVVGSGMYACGSSDSTSGAGGASGASAAGAGGGSATSAGGGGSATTGAGGSSAGSTGGAAGEPGDASNVEDAKEEGDAKDDNPDVRPTIRRPFLVGSSLRSAGALERDDWATDIAPLASPIDPRTLAALSASWQKDALDEHASIAAFARFTMLMLSVGAPPDLIADSQRASLDEIKHARACFALARRYGSRDVGPSALEVADSLGAISLAELAALTVQEGCVGETLGVLLASEQLACAADPEVIRLLRRIVADENRHAELAWRFVKWAVSVGGHEVERRVVEALDEALAQVERVVVRDYAVDLALWHAHGRLSCREAREVSARGVREVVLPCMDAVLREAPQNITPHSVVTLSG
jgi:hypothetical protein